MGPGRVKALDSDWASAPESELAPELDSAPASDLRVLASVPEESAVRALEPALVRRHPADWPVWSVQ